MVVTITCRRDNRNLAKWIAEFVEERQMTILDDGNWGSHYTAIVDTRDEFASLYDLQCELDEEVGPCGVREMSEEEISEL